MIIALDIATKTGYYIAGKKFANTIDLGKGDDRFYNFYQFLEDLIEPYDTENLTIVYEGAPFQKGFATPINPGLVGVLKLFCIEHGIKYTSIPVPTVKRVFVGKGKLTEAKCRQIVKEMKEKGRKEYKLTAWRKVPVMLKCDKLGMKYADDNAADAYAVYYTYTTLLKK